jgi:hypothetical protein
VLLSLQGFSLREVVFDVRFKDKPKDKYIQSKEQHVLRDQETRGSLGYYRKSDRVHVLFVFFLSSVCYNIFKNLFGGEREL